MSFGFERLDFHSSKRPLVEIKRSGKHPSERDGELVIGGDAFWVPLVVFEIHHPFMSEQVGICAFQAGRLGAAVQRDGQMVFRGQGNRLAHEAIHLLVVAVHEVEHHPFNAPLAVERKILLHVLIGRSPVHPEPDSYAFFLGMLEDRR